jgi:hypothetical protein
MQEKKLELNGQITDLQLQIVTEDVANVKGLNNSLSQMEA